jgi:glycine cleavage system regulatory protein
LPRSGPIEHIRNNGSPFFTDTRITVVRDEAGREIGLVIFAVDITERKRIENELKAKCDTLARHINELTQQFNQANQKLQHETIERVETQDRLTHYRQRLQQFVSQFAAELTLEDDLSRVKADFPDLCEKGLLESIINAEKTN